MSKLMNEDLLELYNVSLIVSDLLIGKKQMDACKVQDAIKELEAWLKSRDERLSNERMARVA